MMKTAHRIFGRSSHQNQIPNFHPVMPLRSFESIRWPVPAGLLAMALLLFAAVHWRQSTQDAALSSTTHRQERAAGTGPAPPTQEEAQAIRRQLLAGVETQGLAALSMIDQSWPDSLRRSLRRGILEHHGIQHPLESLDWLARHPRIEGSGPLGVELSSSLHARAGQQAGAAEPWQTAFERFDRIAGHGTQREHLAYLQSALAAMRSAALVPFTAKEIHSMRLRPEVKAVALASLGDLPSGLDFLQPGGGDYSAAHLATREWLTLGRTPVSLTEMANRLLAYAPPGEEGAAEVARSLRHPSLDRNLALWLRSQPTGSARDEVLGEIAADISISDPSFARALLQTPSPE